MDRRPIFDAMRDILLDRGLPGFKQSEVDDLDAAIDRAMQETGEQLAKESGSEKRYRISDRGLDLIKRFEGLRLKAYRCPAGVLTIGYGSTGPHVRAGKVITEVQAESLLRDDVARFEQAVNRLTEGKVTQNQFDALVSFAFNLGAAALERSTLLRKHRAGDYAGAAREFPRWNKAGSRVLRGLVRRRADEAELYRS